jgi:hypothetical protein
MCGNFSKAFPESVLTYSCWQLKYLSIENKSDNDDFVYQSLDIIPSVVITNQNEDGIISATVLISETRTSVTNKESRPCKKYSMEGGKNCFINWPVSSVLKLGCFILWPNQNLYL